MLLVKNRRLISSGAAKNCRKCLAMFGAASTSPERAKSLLSNDKLSDVKFMVPLSLHGGTTDMSKMVIPAHRFLLAIAGPVFYVMFCGILAERNDYIDHLDCDYQWMMEFL